MATPLRSNVVSSATILLLVANFIFERLGCCTTSAFTVPANRVTPNKQQGGRTIQKTRTSWRVGLLESVVNVRDDELVLSESEKENDELRPFHQNWWPVAAITSLDKDRPNPITVLGKSLVVFHDGSSWRVLDDFCSHRFAPLSEGRVVPVLLASGNNDEKQATSCQQNNLQCAYHGWEFDSHGVCTRVPQIEQQSSLTSQQLTKAARPVQSYPAHEEIHMLWVWMDPATADTLGQKLLPQIPIHPQLRRAAIDLGPNYCFQRDLPYGMEILGENLLDLSHLPFAHHSVGFLNRNMGGSLAMKMLSKEERRQVAIAEYENGIMGDDDTQQQAPSSLVIPTFQAEVVDADQYDPLLLLMAKKVNDTSITKNWRTTIGYFEPCHVRYRRNRGAMGLSNVELFLCPTAEGKSRVFLFNTIIRGKPAEEPTSTKASRILSLFKLSTWKDKFFQKLMKVMMAGERGHMMSHSIFDGDGIFLHKQGNRMKQANKTFRDYSTPSSADTLLNAYRRWLDQVAQITRASKLDSMAQSVVGTNAYTGYDDDVARSILLDRYNTHTKHCPLCLASLQKTRRKKASLQVLQTALQGATGASVVCLVLLLSLMRSHQSSVVVAPVVLRAVAVATFGSLVGSWLSSQWKKKLEKKIDSFIFEDYIHAEKI